MVSCGPDAESIERATKIAKDVTGSTFQSTTTSETKKSLEEMAKGKKGSFEVTINGVQGTVTAKYSFTGEFTSTYEDEIEGTAFVSMSMNVELAYDNFKFKEDSEYILQGEVSTSLDVCMGLQSSGESFIYDLIYDAKYVTENFTATNNEVTHTVEMDLGLLIEYSFKYTGDSTTTEQLIVSASGFIMVDGVKVEGDELLDLEVENIFGIPEEM